MSRLLYRLRREGELFVRDLDEADRTRIAELKRRGVVERSRIGSWSGEEYVRLRETAPLKGEV
jgi:hypothetical protein